MIEREALIAELKVRFPALSEELDDESCSGLLHIEVGVFASYTQEQIDAGDAAKTRQCYEVAQRCLAQGSPEVKNAIGVSFLEHLNFADGKRRRSWALAALPDALKTARRELLGKDLDG